MGLALLTTRLPHPSAETKPVPSTKLQPTKEGFPMDILESGELSLCITLGAIAFFSYMYSICTLFPGDVIELARLTLL
jgi:hypothetical protein